METVKDYCTHRLLIAGPKAQLRRFERKVDWTDIPGATDKSFLDRSPGRLVWEFVAASPALRLLRNLSRRWPKLTFFLHYDCEDGRKIGLVRAKNRSVCHHWFQY
jgi:hypothetical protein